MPPTSWRLSPAGQVIQLVTAWLKNWAAGCGVALTPRVPRGTRRAGPRLTMQAPGVYKTARECPHVRPAPAAPECCRRRVDPEGGVRLPQEPARLPSLGRYRGAARPGRAGL